VRQPNRTLFGVRRKFLDRQNHSNALRERILRRNSLLGTHHADELGSRVQPAPNFAGRTYLTIDFPMP
jgi:hypothetical protein